MLRKRVSFTILLSAFALIAQAQNYTSPFSRYGIGELQSGAMAYQRGMGGISLTSIEQNRYSILNPATYAQQKSFGLEAAVSSHIYSIENDQQTFNNQDYRFPYISIAFKAPVQTSFNWGFSAGLIPLSRIGYKLRSNATQPVPSTTEVSGSGGLSKAYLGTGIGFGNFSFGANAGYAFGNNTRTSYLQFPDSLDFINVRRENSSVYKGFRFDFGVGYDIKLDSLGNNHLKLGLTYSMPANISTTRTTEVLSYKSNRSVTFDSIASFSSPDGTVTLPANFGAGLQYRYRNNLIIGLEGEYGQWEDYRVNGLADNRITNSWTLRTGLQFAPKESSTSRSYFRQIRYRAGFKYGQPYITASDGSPITDMSLSIGFGLPLRVSRDFGLTTAEEKMDYNKPYIDISLEAGQMGTPGPGDFRSNYLILTIGAHIFEPNWFRQSKID